MMTTLENYFGDKNENIKMVLRDFGKKIADLEQDIEITKAWMKSQPHLPEIADDALITNMLIKSKFSIEKCKKSLDMYYSLRTLIPEIHVDKNPKSAHMQAVIDINRALPLPQLTKDGHRVTLGRLNFDPETTDIYDVIAHRFAIIEIKFHEDFNLGDIYIEDLSEIKLAHVLKFTPSAIKKATTLFEKGYNIRLKAIHFVNTPSYFDSVFTLIKQLLSPKLSTRLFSHRSFEGVSKFISPQILPIEYGGSSYTFAEMYNLWKKKFVQHQDRFDKLENMMTDEIKRPKPLNNDEVLGYYGNFKKLNVD